MEYKKYQPIKHTIYSINIRGASRTEMQNSFYNGKGWRVECKSYSLKGAFNVLIGYQVQPSGVQCVGINAKILSKGINVVGGYKYDPGVQI